MSSTSKSVLHGYAVMRAVSDELAGESVPVGVIAWDSERGRHAQRHLTEDENVPGLQKGIRPFVEIASRQLNRWAAEARVPYAEKLPLHPSSHEFWQAVSEVLTTAIRLDPPRAMEPMEDFDAQFEALYEAIVQPRQSVARKRHRIDGLITDALGDLAARIPSRVTVSAYHKARETVQRGAVGAETVVLIDGVNLAAARARDEADALVSRLMRIRAAYVTRRVRIIVGYCASPGGLNGEAHMREWIREQLTDDVFDLLKERRGFQMASLRAWQEVEQDPQGHLL